MQKVLYAEMELRHASMDSKITKSFEFNEPYSKVLATDNDLCVYLFMSHIFRF